MFSVFSCYFENWEKIEVRESRISVSTPTEILNNSEKYDQFFIDDIFIEIKVYSKEFAPYSNSDEFNIILFLYSFNSEKKIFIDNVVFDNEKINFSERQLTLEVPQIETKNYSLKKNKYYSHAELILMKTERELPDAFSATIEAHTCSSENKKLLIILKR